MSTAYPNLLDAMLGHMRGSPGLGAAFGDTGTAVTATDKFAPFPVRNADIPWAGYVDAGSDVQYTTGTATIETSNIQFIVVAAGKDIAESLVRLLVKTLNDAPLIFMSGRLMYLRAGSPSAIPIGDLAPNCPNAYAYGVTFQAMTQSTVI